MRPLFRTLIQIEVLSAEPIPDGVDLEEIFCDEFSTKVTYSLINQSVEETHIDELLKAHAIDIKFFD